MFRYTQKQKGMGLEMNQNLPSIVPEKKAGFLYALRQEQASGGRMQKSQRAHWLFGLFWRGMAKIGFCRTWS